MAKKGARQIMGMQCTECKRVNYISERNKTNTPEKLNLAKFCRYCRKHLAHKEVQKLK